MKTPQKPYTSEQLRALITRVERLKQEWLEVGARLLAEESQQKLEQMRADLAALERAEQ